MFLILKIPFLRRHWQSREMYELCTYMYPIPRKALKTGSFTSRLQSIEKSSRYQ